jgi:putative hydrolase of the HAD superfamily
VHPKANQPERGESVRLVLFDVGSTLVDPHPSAQDLMLRVLSRHGRPLSAAELARAEPRAWSAVAHRMPFQRYGQQESWAFWDAFYQALLTELELPSDGPIRREMYEEFRRLENWRLYPDVLPMLEQLRARHIKLGIVSNWEEWLEDLLIALEVHDWFAVVVASGPFGRAKPHPSIFERALELAGEPAKRTVYVGDSPREDVDGARQAGLRPILIDRRGRHAALDVERITALSELPGRLAE